MWMDWTSVEWVVCSVHNTTQIEQWIALLECEQAINFSNGSLRCELIIVEQGQPL